MEEEKEYDMIVDINEPRKFSNKLKALGMRVKREKSITDYRFNKTAVERKSLNDFISSSKGYKGKPPRIFKQAKDLANNFDDTYIIIHDTSAHLSRKETYKENHIIGVMAGLLKGFKINIVRVENANEFIKLVYKLWERGGKKSVRPVPWVRSTATHEERVENMICMVRGIGPVKAKRLMTYAGSISNIIASLSSKDVDKYEKEYKEMEDIVGKEPMLSLAMLLCNPVKYWEGGEDNDN